MVDSWWIPSFADSAPGSKEPQTAVDATIEGDSGSISWRRERKVTLMMPHADKSIHNWHPVQTWAAVASGVVDWLEHLPDDFLHLV